MFIEVTNYAQIALLHDQEVISVEYIPKQELVSIKMAEYVLGACRVRKFTQENLQGQDEVADINLKAANWMDGNLKKEGFWLEISLRGHPLEKQSEIFILGEKLYLTSLPIPDDF